jgi:signal transduction histidine kinase
VSLKLGDGVVQMKVEDDGQGFDTAAEDTDGRGLKNIRARAGLLGASCEMISAPGHGTQVTIKVPVEASDAAH